MTIVWACNRWLGIRISLIGGLATFFAAIFILLSHNHISAGLAGLSLSWILTLTDSLNWIIRFYALLEMNMNSLERLDQYNQLESEYTDTPIELPETVCQ